MGLCMLRHTILFAMASMAGRETMPAVRRRNGRIVVHDVEAAATLPNEWPAEIWRVRGTESPSELPARGRTRIHPASRLLPQADDGCDEMEVECFLSKMASVHYGSFGINRPLTFPDGTLLAADCRRTGRLRTELAALSEATMLVGQFASSWSKAERRQLPSASGLGGRPTCNTCFRSSSAGGFTR